MRAGTRNVVRIRRPSPGDYKAVKKIERIIVDEYIRYLKETGEEDVIEPWITPEYFNHYVRTEASFVAELDSNLVGFILSQPTSYVHGAKKEICLEYIALLPEHRKKGIGTRMISTVIDYAHKHGISTLYTTLNPNNNESTQLLRRHGFEVKDWRHASKKLSADL